MDLGTMRTQVRDIVGELAADFWTDAELNRYLNEANIRFQFEATWPWLLTESVDTLEGGTSTLLLQEGVDVNRHINISLTKEGDTTRTHNPIRVSPTKGFEMRRRYNNLTTVNWPNWYYVVATSDDSAVGLFSSVIKFIPTPADDMDVEYQYYRVPLEMTTDAFVPDLPVQYHKGLVHHAAGTAWLKEFNGGPKATEQFTLYNEVVNQARRENFSDANDAPLVMGKDEPQYKIGRGPEDIWLLRMPETLGN